MFFSFLPSLQNEFVNWDDDNFVGNSKAHGLAPAQLGWMFTTFEYGNYYPLTWITKGLDFFFWGLNPIGYHLTSLLLHTLNSILFYFLIVLFLKQLPGVAPHINSLGFRMCCAFGALFFALHPLRVEPVAWLSARGDVLCGAFYIGCVLAYLRMHQARGNPASNRKWYIISLLLFALSLLSRAWGITLPVVLCILDIYPLGRLSSGERLRAAGKKILIEKIPFFLLAVGAGILALLARETGKMPTITEHGVLARLLQATYGLCFYLWKTVAPLRLFPAYLVDSSPGPAEMKYIICTIIVVLLTVSLIIMRKRWPWALTTWLCYLVIVSPVLGFVQSGVQSAADRYTYLGCLPFGILAGSAVTRLWLQWRAKDMSSALWLSCAVTASAVLLLLSVLTFRQTMIWHDSQTLWRRVIQLDPANYIGHNNLGLVLRDQGNPGEAIVHFREAVRVKPDDVYSRNNLGTALARQGNYQEAVVHFQEALRVEPYYADAQVNWGLVLMRQGNFPEAAIHFQEALRINPDNAKASRNLGAALAGKSSLKEALDMLSEAVRVNPNDAAAHNNLGVALAHEGRLEDAIRHFSEALRINPNNAGAHNNLGTALAREGNLGEAIRHFSEALQINPDDAEARANLDVALQASGQTKPRK